MAMMDAEIEEIPQNVCGVIEKRFVIIGPVANVVEFPYYMYHLKDVGDPKSEETVS